MCSMQLVSDAFCQMNMTAKLFNQYYDFFHLFTALLSLSILQFRIGESKQWVPKCDGGARAGADRCFGDTPNRRKKYIMGYVENMCFIVNCK